VKLSSWFFAIALLAACSRRPTAGGAPVVWTVDGTASIGGQVPTVWGSPQTMDTARGRAVCFDGKKDALLVGKNPLEGLAEFTVEVLFRPDADGSPEQRFVHIAEDGSEDRAMIETRVTAKGTWYLDTFLHKGAEARALIEPSREHAADDWYWAALTYRGRQMRHFVNGVEEGSGTLTFAPLGRGQTSLGARQNKLYWFKGCIRELRISPAALPPDRLQR
jgi:hypothetical protein